MTDDTNMTRLNLLRALPDLEGYAATVLAVVCALAVRLVLNPILTDRAPFLIFILVVVIVMRIWGRGPGLLATLLGGISSWYFILEPQFSFSLNNRADALNLVAFLAIGIGISFIGERSGPARDKGTPRRGYIKLRVIRQTAVLAGAAVVLTGLVLLLQLDLERIRDAENWVEHTYRVINSAESLLSMMKDAENGQRGFLLTGDLRYLAIYQRATASIPKALQELKNLTIDNHTQQVRYIEIGRLTQERLRSLQLALDLRATSGIGAAVAAVRSGQGAEAMDSLRSVLESVMGEERRLLISRTEHAERESMRGRWVLGLGSGVLILLLVLASVVIERETVRREEIAETLRRHANLLEQAHDSLMTCPLGGAIDYWSRGSETLFGFSREEALGSSPHQLLQTDHPLGIAHVDALLERDGHWEGELTQTTKDGRKLTVEARWVLATDSDGRKSVLEAGHDITERKRAEAENLLLATAIEQAAETVVITDRDAKIQYVNPAFSRTTGYNHDEALGLNPRVLQSGQHATHFYREMWGTLTAGRLWRGEFTNRRKDGTLYTEEAAITPVRSPAGEIINYIAIKSDITERKRAETALRESEMMLRFFVQHAPAAIAMLDREMRYLVVSQRWMTDYHLGDRDIRGLRHYEVFPELPDRWKEIHRRCLDGAVESCPEESFPRPDGRVDWLSWEVRPWRKADDSIGGIIIFSEAITERVEAKKALEESQARYRDFISHSNEGVWRLELAKPLPLTLTMPETVQWLLQYAHMAECNLALARSLRFSSVEEVVGKPLKDLIPAWDLERLALTNMTPSLRLQPRTIEVQSTDTGGRPRHFLRTEVPIIENGALVRMWGVTQDITESKLAEEKVRQLNFELEQRVRSRTAALEAANRELEAFAHSVSHDLRAPLRGIDGWSLALLEDYGTRLDAQGQKYLERVRGEAQRMGRLIDDLLHLSRVSRADLIPSEVDLSSVAESIVQRLKDTHPDRSVQFVVAPHLSCTGDARLLEIALTNLLDNAVKFTGPCVAARVEVGETVRDGDTAYFVRDNGVGFDVAHASTLFAPFQRLHKPTEFPGSGIGLATVQRVIHRHGGEIWPEARVGEGATFYFTLGVNNKA